MKAPIFFFITIFAATAAHAEREADLIERLKREVPKHNEKIAGLRFELEGFWRQVMEIREDTPRSKIAHEEAKVKVKIDEVMDKIEKAQQARLRVILGEAKSDFADKIIAVRKDLSAFEAKSKKLEAELAEAEGRMSRALMAGKADSKAAADYEKVSKRIDALNVEHAKTFGSNILHDYVLRMNELSDQIVTKSIGPRMMTELEKTDVNKRALGSLMTVSDNFLASAKVKTSAKGKGGRAKYGIAAGAVLIPIGIEAATGRSNAQAEELKVEKFENAPATEAQQSPEEREEVAVGVLE